MARHKVHYKGEGGDFPLGHGEYCEFLFAHGSSVHQECSNYTLTNLLFDLFLNLPSLDPGAPGNAPQLLVLPLSSPLESQLSPSKNLKVRHTP